jgi:hypothetical protein
MHRRLKRQLLLQTNDIKRFNDKSMNLFSIKFFIFENLTEN